MVDVRFPGERDQLRAGSPEPPAEPHLARHPQRPDLHWLSTREAADDLHGLRWSLTRSPRQSPRGAEADRPVDKGDGARAALVLRDGFIAANCIIIAIYIDIYMLPTTRHTPGTRSFFAE